MVKKNSSVKVLSIVALVAAVLGLTVAFAAMSRTLVINGTANMDTAKWDIHFANLSDAKLTGAASVTTAPEIDKDSSTIIGDYEVVLTKPGDSITYTFDVKNEGTINAKIGTFVKQAKPTCTSTIGKDSDAALVCDNLTYTLTYTDGGESVAENDILNASDTKNLTLKLKYDGDSLPTDDVEISGLGITIVYDQN